MHFNSLLSLYQQMLPKIKNTVQIILMVFVLSGCKSNNHTYDNYESELLKIERVNENVFKHISYLDTKSYGKYPCNGMVYFNGNEAIIFDTPTNNKATTELINWIGKKDIKAVVVTHFHVDCLGGLQKFHSNKIKSYATNKTIELAKEDNQTLPQNSFDQRLEFTIGNEIVIAEFFGQGHTKDNIIGYVPSEKTMFGGCLIKKLNAEKGNLTDANIADWPKTVEKIKRELPGIEIIIPGHGKSGGVELLDYTIGLFTNNQ